MATFRDILQYYRHYWRSALLSIGASSFFEIADLAVPYAIGQILNLLSQQPLDPLVQSAIAPLVSLGGLSPRSAALGLLLSLIGLVTIVRAPIQPWLGLWFHWAIPLKARRDQTQRVIEKILSLPLEFYDENNPGRIAGRVARGLENHTWSYPEVAGQLVPKLARVLGIFVILWFIEWRIALLLLVSFVGILVLGLRSLRILIHQERLLDRHQENTESRTSEIITNIKTVKAFATETRERERQSRRLDRELMVVLERIHRGYVNLNTWQSTVIQACVFGVLVFALVETMQGRISLGHFVTTLTVSSMAYAELSPINTLAETFARRYASMVRFHEFMQRSPGRDAITFSPEPPTANPYQFTGKLEFDHVSFGYQPDKPVLKDISLCIEPCQTVALVGRSGSGKSTLVKLLFRYFEPTQGAIRLDGLDIRRLEVDRYRRRLAIVHQEVDVFNGTLMDNLTYGNPQASPEQVREACRIARVDEFLDQLPKGYNTVVGERGLRLSGGQRQRLGIARALIVNPDVLVFDEATSSLDYESERSIQLAMRSLLGTRTLLIIAHRLSTVREADQIIVLDRGEIVEVGNHEELLRHGGLYHRLHALQETGELWG